MFTYHKKARMFWFSTDSCEDYQEFNLVGVVSLGINDARTLCKAIYNNNLLYLLRKWICVFILKYLQ